MKKSAKIISVALSLTVAFTAISWNHFQNNTVSAASASAVTTTDGSYEWSNVNIGGGGFVTGVIQTSDPNVYYARTDVGGAYRWDNNNKTWVSISADVSKDTSSALGIESIAVDPSNSNTVYMFAGLHYTNDSKSYILRSTNGGKSFEYISVPFRAHGNGQGRNTGERLIVDPNNSSTLYCGTRWDGIWKSTDKGSTWTQIMSAPSTSYDFGVDMIIIDKSSKTIFAGVGNSSNNFYKSTDGGKTWSDISLRNGYFPQKYDISNGKLYVTFANKTYDTSTAGSIAVYTISTGKWQTLYTNSSYGLGGISVDYNNNNRMVATLVNIYAKQYWEGNSTPVWGTKILTSTDGGKNWTEHTADNNNLVLDSNGRDWIESNSLHWSGDVTLNQGNTSKAFITSGDGIFELSNLFTSKAVKATFMVNGIEESVPLDIVAPATGDAVLVAAEFDTGGYRLTNVDSYPTTSLGNTTGHTTGIAVCPTNTNFMVYTGRCYKDGGYYYFLRYSTDNGISWKEVPNSHGLGQLGSVAISADGSHVYWMPSSNSSEWSTNYGQTLYTFTYKNGSFTGYTSKQIFSSSTSGVRVVADTVTAGTVYISSGDYLYYSTDYGNNFNKVANPDSNKRINRITAVPTKAGEVWQANGEWSNTSLVRYKTVNGQMTATAISNVSKCEAVGFGKAADGASYPTIYIWGTVNGTNGLFRSTNEGNTWTRINDDYTQFGGVGNGMQLVGDMRTFGTVYMTTSGMGIRYGKCTSNSSQNSTTATQPTTSQSTEATTTGAASSTAYAELTNNGIYTFTNVNSGKCLDVYNGLTAEGSNIGQWESNGLNPQQFKAVKTSDGYYKLLAACSNYKMAVTVKGGKNSNNTNIELSKDADSDSQKFAFIKNSDGSYSIVTKVSGFKKAIDVSGASKNNGANVIQYNNKYSNNQKWKLSLITSESSTEKVTEASTEKATEKVTEKATEASTEVSTEAPTSSSSTGNKNISCTYKVTSDWGSGFSAEITVTNTGSTTINGWTVEFDYGCNINSLWGATLSSSSNNHYVVTNPAWSPDLAPGQSCSVCFIASGSSSTQPANYVIK